MGGGVFYDMGVYVINGVCFLIGCELLVVMGSYLLQCFLEMFIEVDEMILFMMDFGDGLVVDCGISVVKGFNYFKVDCEMGWY